MPLENARTGLSSSAQVEIERLQHRLRLVLAVWHALQLDHVAQEIPAAQIVGRIEALGQERQTGAGRGGLVADAEDADAAPPSVLQKSSRHLISVVLPAPFTPASPKDSPASTVRLKPASATDWPKRLRTSPNWSAGAVLSTGRGSVVIGLDATENSKDGRAARRELWQGSICGWPDARTCHSAANRRRAQGARPGGRGGGGHLVQFARLIQSGFRGRRQPGRDRQRRVPLRRAPGAQGHQHALPAREGGLDHGAVRLRQDHHAAPDRRPAQAQPRAGASRRRAGPRARSGSPVRAAPAHGDVVPVRSAVHRPVRVRQRGLPAARAHRAARAHDPRPGAHEAQRGGAARRAAA